MIKIDGHEQIVSSDRETETDNAALSVCKNYCETHVVAVAPRRDRKAAATTRRGPGGRRLAYPTSKPSASLVPSL